MASPAIVPTVSAAPIWQSQWTARISRTASASSPPAILNIAAWMKVKSGWKPLVAVTPSMVMPWPAAMLRAMAIA